MKIVVMCGGISPERNVSISTSTTICRTLRAMGHRAALCDMFFGLEDYDGDIESYFDDAHEMGRSEVGGVAPDMDEIINSRKWKSKSKIGKRVLELCEASDLVFIGMHGVCGEDGRIQAALDLLGVPYTGSGYIGSAIAMDKDLTKRMVSTIGVLTPKWKTVSYREEEIESVADSMPLPCVVKPVDSGSSIGVYIAFTRDEMISALKKSLGYERVVLEEYIKGREIDVGVFDDKSLPAIEIILKSGFFDYENKYVAGNATEVCPVDIAPEIEQKLRDTALAVHRLLGLSAYSRSDYMVDENGNVYFIEMNTLPGMTPTSLLPQEAAKVGISYSDLCGRIVEIALEEHK